MGYLMLLGSALAIFTSAVVAAPLSASEMGSKHNLYLTTCTRRSTTPGCPLIIICPKSAPEAAAQSFTAAAYFANGVSSGSNGMTEMTVVSETAEPWEGAQRVGRFQRESFSSTINKGADTLDKSQIAGQARMGTEEFACFRDGETAFSVVVRQGLLDRDTISCTADYWCASLSV